MKTILTVFLTVVLSSVAGAHDSPPNALPFEACAAGQLNDPCQYTSSDQHRYIGTCRSINKMLMCVRNKPIEHLVEIPEHKEEKT